MATSLSYPLDTSSASPVLIACPVTRGLVTTGQFVESVDQLPMFNLLRDCPDCGANHPWSSDEAVLANSGLYQ